VGASRGDWSTKTREKREGERRGRKKGGKNKGKGERVEKKGEKERRGKEIRTTMLHHCSDHQVTRK